MTPRRPLTAVVPVHAGVVYALAAPDVSNGNSLAGYNGNMWLLVTKADASPANVTIKSNGAIKGGMVVGDRVVSVTNGTSQVIKLPDPDVCVQSDGNVNIDWAAGTWTACVLKL